MLSWDLGNRKEMVLELECGQWGWGLGHLHVCPASPGMLLGAAAAGPGLRERGALGQGMLLGS